MDTLAIFNYFYQVIYAVLRLQMFSTIVPEYAIITYKSFDSYVDPQGNLDTLGLFSYIY